MEAILVSGIEFPMTKLSTDDCRVALEEGQAYGNHKSAKDAVDSIIQMLEDETVKGWQIPLPLECLKETPGAMVTPMGCAHQFSIDEQGTRISKDRLTHNLYFAFTPGSAVNDRIDLDKCSPCTYGHAITRYLHCRPPVQGKLLTEKNLLQEWFH